MGIPFLGPLPALPAWTLAALALLPTLLAARLAVPLQRAPALIAMEIALAAWLVTVSLEELSLEGAHWLVQALALVVPALLWTGARQWQDTSRPWVAPAIAAAAAAVLQLGAQFQPWTGAVASAALADGVPWLHACGASLAATLVLARTRLARTRVQHLLLWSAAAAPAIPALLGTPLVPHPASLVPLIAVLGWRFARSGALLTGLHRLAEPMFAVDDRGWVLDANPASFALLGVPGDNLRDFRSHVVGVPGLRSLLEDPARECAEVFTGSNAATRRCHEARVIRSPGEGLRVIAIQDVTTRRESEQELVHQARFDSLTGLANRRYFIMRLESEIADAQASGTTLAVMYIDLDRFKAINDSYGHAAGDELLRTVAHRLRQGLRTSDVAPSAQTWLARLGGDEFALLLPKVDAADEASRVATRVLEVLGEPVILEGSKVWNAASVGIALYPDHGSDVDSLLRAADAALYRAKTTHRGGYQIFEPALRDRARRQANIDRLLRKALASNSLEIHYQPKYSLRDRTLGGAEALLRWEDPELGPVAPKEFVPVAEETGLIRALGEWVLERVCSDIARWRSEGAAMVPVSFNASNRQFVESGMLQLVADTLKRHSLDPHCLEMELTESSILENDERTAACLRGIRELGVRISLDDFGTGYSSLACLNRVPLDLLKMDRNLVRDVHTDPGARGVVSAVVAMAHSLALEVVAEGVDCDEQVAVLAEMGCDWVQGFVFGAAMPEREFAELLRGPAELLHGPAQTREKPETVYALPAPDEPETAASEAQDGRALIVDDGSGRLGVLAMRMNRIGTVSLYASALDEALLFAAEPGPPIRALIAAADADVSAFSRLVDRIAEISGGSPALLFVAADDLPKPLLDLRRRCRIWTLREPASDAELRDVAQAMIVGSPPGAALRRHPRAPCDSLATVTVGDDSGPALLTSLSVGGAFLEFTRRPPKGTRVDVAFALADATIRASGTVAYHHTRSGHLGTTGIGVVFETLSDEHCDAIRATVEQRSVRCLA